MAKMRVEFIARFYMGEDDAVLVAADRDGIDQLAGAIRQACQPIGSPSVLRANQRTHVFMTEAGGGTIEFRNGDVIWRLSKERMEEIADKLESMKESPGPCHHYVEIVAPASTLILSRDEYPDR
ncbi:MAG: hypothetical protein ACRD4E_07380 [Bryobacteraceae bacterium]